MDVVMTYQGALFHASFPSWRLHANRFLVGPHFGKIKKKPHCGGKLFPQLIEVIDHIRMLINISIGIVFFISNS